LIEPHRRHRVVATDSSPRTLWLALFLGGRSPEVGFGAQSQYPARKADHRERPPNKQHRLVLSSWRQATITFPATAVSAVINTQFDLHDVAAANKP